MKSASPKPLYLLGESDPDGVIGHELQVVEQPEDDGPAHDVHERAGHDAVRLEPAHGNNNVQRVVLLVLVLVLLLARLLAWRLLRRRLLHQLLVVLLVVG